MDWPRTPVERIPAKRFNPPFCPWENCRSHHTTSFRAVRYGSYRRQCDRRSIPRFRCQTCLRTFSQQTFSCTYYLKKPKLLHQVAAALVASCAARQIARTLECSHTSVVNQANRIGRHALLLHSVAAERSGPMGEAVVFDHAESFQFCQEMPLGIGTVVGRDSLYTYGLDPVPHRLGGERSPGRVKRLKALQKRYGRFPKGSYRQSTSRILDRLLSRVAEGERLHLITDGKPEYQSAAASHIDAGRLVHEVHPNPPRRRKHEPRGRHAVARDRAMYPVDLLHKLMRHSNANHKRETLAFGRRANAILLRDYAFTAWRNFGKDVSERCPQGRSPGMKIGLTDRIWSWREILGRRLFPWRVRLSTMDRNLYSMGLITPAVGRNRRHDLLNAF